MKSRVKKKEIWHKFDAAVSVYTPLIHILNSTAKKKINGYS